MFIYNKPCLLIICAEATVLHGQNKELHSVYLVVLNHTKSEQSWTKNLICYKAKILNLLKAYINFLCQAETHLSL